MSKVNHDIWRLTAPYVGGTVPPAAFLIDPTGLKIKGSWKRVSLQYGISNVIVCEALRCYQLCSSQDVYLFMLQIESSGQRN
jgi:hypothetical protein